MKKTARQDIGNFIKTHRERSGISLRKAESLIHISQDDMMSIETGGAVLDTLWSRERQCPNNRFYAIVGLIGLSTVDIISLRSALGKVMANPTGSIKKNSGNNAGNTNFDIVEDFTS